MHKKLLGQTPWGVAVVTEEKPPENVRKLGISLERVEVTTILEAWWELGGT